MTKSSQHAKQAAQTLALASAWAALVLSCLLLAPPAAPAAARDSKPVTFMAYDYSAMDTPEAGRILFHPRSSPRTALPPGAEDLDVPLEDGTVLGCRVFAAEPGGPVLLFFHGNGEIVADYDDIGPLYQQRGITCMVAEYRGYGWSTGTPMASAMMRDAHAVYAALRRWMADRGHDGPVFLMGRSLGSASAIELAASLGDEVRGLIIESGFAETLPLARTLGYDAAAAGYTEEHGFRNQEKIAHVTRPILIIHGQHDQLIPLVQAEKLHAAAGARSKELQVVPGADHNTVMSQAGLLYFDTIRQFMNKSAGLNTWRDRRRRSRQQQRDQAGT